MGHFHRGQTPGKPSNKHGQSIASKTGRHRDSSPFSPSSLLPLVFIVLVLVLVPASLVRPPIFVPAQAQAAA
jgi:hypothetical protein